MLVGSRGAGYGNAFGLVTWPSIVGGRPALSVSIDKTLVKIQQSRETITSQNKHPRQEKESSSAKVTSGLRRGSY